MEEVVVVGKRPGPPLWRVDNGDRTLWIFGTLEPLPRSLEWDSESVEWIISQSEQYITAPNISARTSNPIKAISTVRKIRKLQKLPRGQTLGDVLPENVFHEFLDAKSRFATRDRKLMGLRPLFVARDLSKRAYESVGLTNRSKIRQELRKMAKKHGIEIVTTNGELGVNEALQVLQETSMTAEIQCLETTLESVNSDLQSALAHALAWIEGDATNLKTFDYPDVDSKCTDETFNHRDAVKVRNQTRAQWLSIIEMALQNNNVTFASLPIRELIHPQGLLAVLRKSGYKIRGQ